MNTSTHTVIRAEAIRFSDLFHQGRFAVPWHQRYYDWQPGDVRALLDDIAHAVQEKCDCYFLGSIMLIDTDSRVWEINDGQQRMVTFSLICAALCRQFTEVKDSQREGLALRILFNLPATTVVTLDKAEQYTPRISPPQNDAMQYHQIIRGNTIGANGKLTDAWNEIEKFLSQLNSQKLEQYFNFLLEKLEVACLRIPPHIDPNAVYETINSRGKQLDNLDKIRNYLYSYFNAETDKERKNSVHDNLERVRARINRVTKASAYMRCHLQCKFGFLRKDKFYRDARQAVQSQMDNKHSSKKSMTDYVFNLTKQISSPEYLELYEKITAPNPDLKFIQTFKVSSRTTNSRRNLAVFLQELNGYGVTQPLVFAILTQYIRETDGRKKKKIARIANKNLSRLATFVLRTAFVAPKFEPSHFESEFSDYAKHIMMATDIPDTEFAEFLRNCDQSGYGVLDDSKFQSEMTEKKITGVAKMKQFLLGINGNLQSDAGLLNARLCTVEHILPKSQDYWAGWSGFKDTDAGDWVNRFGNLTLLGPTDNKPGPKFNGDFAKKKEIYKSSGIQLTRDIPRRYSDWTPGAIEKRQRKMVRRAVQVWVFR